MTGNDFTGTPNGMDLLLTSTAGTVSAVTSNVFAGTLYIANQSSQPIDATTDTFGLVGPTDNTLADLYGVEDRINDGLDSSGLGYVKLRTGYDFVAYSSETANPGAIQRGINLATSGDVVNVQGGTTTTPEVYAADAQITITQGVTLQGGGAATTIIDGRTATLSSAGTISISHPTGAVKVDGFTFQNPGSDSGGDIMDIVVSHGVAAAPVTISNNDFIGLNDGTQFDDAIWTYSTDEPITISSNEFAGMWQAILLEQPRGGATVSGNTFQDLVAGVDGSTIYGPEGIKAMTYSGENDSNPVVLNGNTFQDYSGYGIWVSAGYPGSGQGQFRDLQITNNTILSAGVAGIIVENPGTTASNAASGGVPGAIISGNTITGASTTDGSTGILLWGPSSNVSITNNAISDENTGIASTEYTAGAGFSSGTVVSQNSIAGNGAGVSNGSTDPANAINASGNWWGSANGPTTPLNTYASSGTGDTVSGNVSVIPWYTSNATTSQTPGWYPAGALDTATPGVALSTVTLADGVTPADGSTAGGWTTNTKTPTFSGTAAPGSTVAVLEGATVLGQTTAAGDGTWSITLASSSALSEGTNSIVARATSSSGEQGFISNPTSVTVGVATTPAFIGLTASQSILYGTATTTFSGTITAGPFFPTGSVTVSIVDTAITGNATINPDGTFTCDLTTSSLQVAHGAYTIRYAYSDATGVYGSVSDTSKTLTITRATPSVTVVDGGGQYSTNAFAATDATVTGVGGGTIAGFGDPSLSYTYYQGGSGSSAAPTAVGTYSVVAHYAGSDNYTTADSSAVIFHITPATPTVTASDLGGVYTGSAFPATATLAGVGSQSTPAATLETVGTTFTYYAGNYATTTALDTAIADGQTAALVGGAPSVVGDYTVVAHFAGSPDYNAADSNPVSFSITEEVWVDQAWAGTPSDAAIDHSAISTAVIPGDINLVYGVNAFSTIQGGVNGVNPGGTVDVLPGTYAEDVLVNKSLTLSGASRPRRQRPRQRICQRQGESGRGIDHHRGQRRPQQPQSGQGHRQ